jgi:hypothetical protein
MRFLEFPRALLYLLIFWAGCAWIKCGDAIRAFQESPVHQDIKALVKWSTIAALLVLLYIALGASGMWLAMHP